MKQEQQGLRILFLIHNQAETGPYWKVLEQCAAYVKLGHSVTLVCTSKTRRWGADYQSREGVEVLETPDLLRGKFRQGVDLWNAWWRIRLLRGQIFDVLHAVDCRPNVLIPALSLHRRGIPFVLAWWDLFGSESKRFGNLYARTFGKIEGWLETAFRIRADASIAITSYLADKLREIGVKPDTIVVQHLGCDTSVQPLPYEQAREKICSQHSIKPTETIFCFAGTIYDSDFLLLLQSLDVLRERGCSYRIIWIGKHTISQEIQRRYNILHVGVVPTMAGVYEYFAAADACILPMEVNVANAARWHSKVTDYLNAGAPVVLTPVSDFPRHFSRFDMGWLAASGSAEDYAGALEQAIVGKSKRAEKSNNARSFVRQELDVMTIAQQTIVLYQKVCTTATPS